MILWEIQGLDPATKYKMWGILQDNWAGTIKSRQVLQIKSDMECNIFVGIHVEEHKITIKISTELTREI